ncbi:MAG: aldehyde dehydrogenase family protein, partial [Acidobacteria bacterium]|nr:aldehyde dehydrogenase family protein [Acidobacteriota bacterium]
MSVPVYYNFINGREVASSTGRTFENRNPANPGEVLGLFQDSGPEDARCAVSAAVEAFGTWRNVPAPRRAEVLYRAAQLLVERKEQLARDMTREMGKVL